MPWTYYRQTYPNSVWMLFRDDGLGRQETFHRTDGWHGTNQLFERRRKEEVDDDIIGKEEAKATIASLDKDGTTTAEANEGLTRQARDWNVVDPATARCWHLIVQGMELKWHERQEMRELIASLSTGADYGIEELLFAHQGAAVTVSLLDDRTTCPTAALEAELQSFMATVDSGSRRDANDSSGIV